MIKNLEKKPPDGYKICGRKCEVYSRCVGYLRPVDQWNIGKKQEFKDRRKFDEDISKTKVSKKDNKTRKHDTRTA